MYFYRNELFIYCYIIIVTLVYEVMKIIFRDIFFKNYLKINLVELIDKCINQTYSNDFLHKGIVWNLKITTRNFKIIFN